MLRITVQDDPRVIRFQLEGRLHGPWLQELEECWRRTLASDGKPILLVDLTGLTFVDKVGKAQLATMHRQGAEFVANDCLMKDIVAEITRRPEPPRERDRPEPAGRKRWFQLAAICGPYTMCPCNEVASP